MRTLIRFLFLLATLTLASGLAFPNEGRAEFKKTKIAVLDFQVQGGRSDTSDIGKIVAEWLITALVKDGRFDVIERRLLEKVLEEQKIEVSGIVDADSASQLGKVLGAKVVITGSVLEYQDIVEVNARIIEVESGSIIAAENAKSTSTVRLEDLVVDMAQKIIKDFPLEGYIVSREGNTVLIDLGFQAGVRTGLRFEVYKEGRIIKHPKTGEVLDIETIETGEIQITDVGKKTSTGTIVKETSPQAIVYGLMVRSLAQGEDLTPTVEEQPRVTPPAKTEPVRKKSRKRERSEDEPERKVNIPSPTF